MSKAGQPQTWQLFEAWYESGLSGLFGYIYYRVQDRALTEELIASVCEKALANLHQFDAERGVFGAWMFGIARNTVNYHLRSQKSRPILQSLDALPLIRTQARPVEADVQTRETLKEILQHISSLPEQDQDIIAMRYGMGMSNQEIAEVIEITPNYVRVRLYRALKRVRSVMEAEQEAYHA